MVVGQDEAIDEMAVQPRRAVFASVKNAGPRLPFKSELSFKKPEPVLDGGGIVGADRWVQVDVEDRALRSSTLCSVNHFGELTG